MIKKYIKKPIPVEAMVYDGTFVNAIQISEWSWGKVEPVLISSTNTGLVIHTLEGTMRPNVGDYVVKGPAGEFWFVKKEIFEATYEEIKDE